MATEPPLSPWAMARFGERAPLVRRALVDALTHAVGNAQDAQKVAETDKRYTFGFTLMSRKYEVPVDTFADMADVKLVRPWGLGYQLPVVSGNLLLPFSFRKTPTNTVMHAQIGSGGELSAFLKVVFARFGRKRTIEQLSLDIVDENEAQRLTAVNQSLSELPDDTRLVLVPFACDTRAGLQELWWGEAELLGTRGALRWGPLEQIPLPAAAQANGTNSYLGDSRSSSPAASRFNEGPLPDTSLKPRPEIERQNEEAFPPLSEAQPAEPDIADDEKD